MKPSKSFATGLRRGLLTLAWALSPAFANQAPQDTVAAAVASRACAVIAARVDAVPGNGGVLLRSFDGSAGAGPSSEVALATAAFAYDNALAVIALVACDRPTQAQRIGVALLLASGGGGLRNAYLAGAQKGTPVANGWWSAKEGRWLQDPYQTGIATGNAAWVALALLTLGERTHERRWVKGAERIGSWVVDELSDDTGPGGFVGGFHGFDGQRTRLLWKSSEHQVDLAALFGWLARTSDSGRWRPQAARARHCLDTQFDATAGRFYIGTLPDGHTSNRAVSGLDAQLWPLLLPDANPEWRVALAFAERAHGVPGGFDFNDDRDGLWVEGTAQAALVYRSLGRMQTYSDGLTEVSTQFSAGGLLYATREPRITTGLAINPDSPSADFYYFHTPHLGATAWAALAALGWNPLVGGTVDRADDAAE